jgi:hypothetical protein
MYRRIRIPLLVASLAFLAFALWAFWHHAETGLSILHPDFFKLDESARGEETTASYATRIRADAYRRMGQGDYDNALVRLDQAAEYDPETDRASSEVRQARKVIAEKIALLDAPTRPGQPSSPRARP